MNSKQKAKKDVKRIIEKLLKQKHQFHDMALHTTIIMSLTREEMSAMYRYHEMIRFISAIEVYDDVLYILAKDKTELGKDIFKKILAIRNKIARQHRNKTKKNEELFRLNKREPKPKKDN